jgi:hypothetical protein
MCAAFLFIVKGRNDLGDLDIDGRLILKQVLENYLCACAHGGDWIHLT